MTATHRLMTDEENKLLELELREMARQDKISKAMEVARLEMEAKFEREDVFERILSLIILEDAGEDHPNYLDYLERAKTYVLKQIDLVEAIQSRFIKVLVRAGLDAEAQLKVTHQMLFEEGLSRGLDETKRLLQVLEANKIPYRPSPFSEVMFAPPKESHADRAQRAWRKVQDKMRAMDQGETTP